MKKHLVLLAFLGTTLTTFSQDDRIDDAPPVITSKGSLTAATGWLKNQAGKWMSRTNRIPSDLDVNALEFTDVAENALGEDNFISLELKEVTYQGKTYNLFAKKRTWGAYEYQSIRRGWYTYKDVELYFFDNTQYGLIDSLQYDTATTIKIQCSYKYDYPIFGDMAVKLQDEVKAALDGKGKIESYHDNGLYLVAKAIKAKQVVRFIFYRAANSFDKSYGFDFSRMYYEVPIASFKKLFPKMVIY